MEKELCQALWESQRALSTADFAGKAFVIPLGSAFNTMRTALVLRVYQGIG